MPIEQNAKPSASTQTNSPRNSPTTTSPEPANSPTGIELSGRGLATLRNFLQNEKTPNSAALNRQILASLKSDCGSRLVIKTRCDSDYNAIDEDIAITGKIPEKWRDALEYITRPANGRTVAAEVTRLRTLTAKRAEGEFDMELSIGAITEELQPYPEDIVRTVCRDWARENKWFPTLSELIAECDALHMPRLKLLNAVSSALPLPAPKPDAWTPPTDSEKQAVSAMIDGFLNSHRMAAQRPATLQATTLANTTTEAISRESSWQETACA